MKAIITSARNGASVRFIDHDGERINKTDVVFEFDSDLDEGAKLNGLVEMLYEIMDFFGWNLNTKYSKERIEISLKHGRDYQCVDNKNCEICKEGAYETSGE